MMARFHPLTVYSLAVGDNGRRMLPGARSFQQTPARHCYRVILLILERVDRLVHKINRYSVKIRRTMGVKAVGTLML